MNEELDSKIKAIEDKLPKKPKTSKDPKKTKTPKEKPLTTPTPAKPWWYILKIDDIFIL